MSNNSARLQVVLHNIRSTYNVGAILRTAEGLGVEKVILSGYTPKPNDPELLPHLRDKLTRQIAKSALGAEEMVPQETVCEIEKWIREQKSAGWKIVGLENNLDMDEAPRKRLLGEDLGAERIVLVLGEEVAGIPKEIRSEMDIFLEIPMPGRKESFNVSVAAGMAMWALSVGARVKYKL